MIRAALFVAMCCMSAVAEQAPRTAETSGTTGPIKLTLIVRDTVIPRHEETRTHIDVKRLAEDHSPNVDVEKYQYSRRVRVGDSLWIKLRLSNVGSHIIKTSDEVFLGPKNFAEALESNRQLRYDTYLSLIGPDGKAVPWESMVMMEPCQESQAWRPADSKTQAKVEAWRKEGLSIEQINDLLQKEENEQARYNEDHRPVRVLKPGESLSTGPWVFPGFCKGDREPQPPRDDYAELWNYRLKDPGVYYLKAYYRGSDGYKGVLVQTGRIRIEVQP